MFIGVKGNGGVTPAKPTVAIVTELRQGRGIDRIVALAGRPFGQICQDSIPVMQFTGKQDIGAIGTAMRRPRRSACPQARGRRISQGGTGE